MGSKHTPVAMVLAAGRGERMRPLTDTTPKPLLKVGGKPLIERHVERLAASGFERIVINHAWLGEQIEAAMGNGERWGVMILYSPEHEALETAGGIANALHLIAEDAFAVVNADVYTDYDFACLRKTNCQLLHDSSRLAHLILVDNPEHHPNGDFALDGNRVSTGTKAKLTFSGLAAYRREFFSTVSPGEKQALGPMLTRQASAGKVSGEYFPGCWSDIGTPQRLTALDRRLSGQTE